MHKPANSSLYSNVPATRGQTHRSVLTLSFLTETGITSILAELMDMHCTYNIQRGYSSILEVYVVAEGVLLMRIFEIFPLDDWNDLGYHTKRAGVVKLVDALDSKSSGP